MLRKVATRMAPKSGHCRAKRFNFLKQFKNPLYDTICVFLL